MFNDDRHYNINNTSMSTVRRRDVVRNRIGTTNLRQVIASNFENIGGLNTSGQTGAGYKDRSFNLHVNGSPSERSRSVNARTQRGGGKESEPKRNFRLLSLPLITSTEGRNPTNRKTNERSLNFSKMNTFIPKKKEGKKHSGVVEVLESLRHQFKDKESLRMAVVSWRSQENPNVIEFNDFMKRLELMGYSTKREELEEFSKLLGSKNQEPVGIPIKEFITATFMTGNQNFKREMEEGDSPQLVINEIEAETVRKEQSLSENLLFTKFSRYKDFIHNILKEKTGLTKDSVFDSMTFLGLGNRNVDEKTKDLFVKRYIEPKDGCFRSDLFYKEMEEYNPNHKMRVEFIDISEIENEEERNRRIRKKRKEL